MTKKTCSRSIVSVLLLIALGCVAPLWRAGLAARGTAAKPTPVAPLSNASSSLRTVPPRTVAPADEQQQCTVNCDATVPANGQSGTAVPFQSTASTAGCAGAPTYDWNFGDGTPRSNQQNPSHTYASAGTYTWALNVSAPTSSTIINTIAGGLGEGNFATQAPLGSPVAVARDARGLFVADVIGGVNVIRFVNTGNAAVTVAGRSVAPGALRIIAGGGQDTGNNVAGLLADLGTVSSLAVNGNGSLLYFANSLDRAVRALNLSGANQVVGADQILPGNVGTLASMGFDNGLSGVAVHPTNGDIYVVDATSGVNKVFRITPAGQASTVAGNGANSDETVPFTPGPAISIPLLQPRAIEFDPAGNLYVADTGHARVIRVDAGGAASLVVQFTADRRMPTPPYSIPPYPAGLAYFSGRLYIANGNTQNIARVDGTTSVSIAGTIGTACNYSSSNCGDGGLIAAAGFNMNGSTGSVPVAGMEADANGLLIVDQASETRGRIRLLNLTSAAVTLNGVSVAAGNLDTVVGSGLTSPYDGALATNAQLQTPIGTAVDANNNLWISDTIPSRIRFINRGSSPVTLFQGTAAQQTVAAGAIITINREAGASNDAHRASFDSPQGLFAVSNGIFVVDSRGGVAVPTGVNGRRTSLLKFINTSNTGVTFFTGSSSPIPIAPGTVGVVAGGGTNQTTIGDNGFATSARFHAASDVLVTSNGTIYLADVGNKAVRRIDGGTGVVTSLNLPANKQYTGLGLDAAGRLYVTNFDDNQLLRETAANSGQFARLDSGSSLNRPRDVVVDAAGNAYVTNAGEPPPTNAGANANRIMRVAANGTVTTFAGTTAGFGGDGGAATDAQINLGVTNLVYGQATVTAPFTVGITTDTAGNILFADTVNNRIRQLSVGAVTCTKTGTITIGGQNPTPAITTISPNAALTGSAAFTLTVTGTGFVPSSKVNWNNQERPTTFVSATQLTAQIPASDIINAGTAQVTVVTPAPGGGTSNAVPFMINAPNPVPMISSITPNTAVEGSAAFTLTVTGDRFVNNSVVRWDGQARQTTFVSATRLTAQILVSDLVGVGQAQVTVFNPTPGGGLSNAVPFTITAGQNPVPTLTGINPNTAAAGTAGLVLITTGTNFVQTSRVRWNGSDRVSTFVSATEVRAEITAADLAAAGTAQVTVFNPTPGGGVTGAQTFTINAGQNNPVPTATSISPNIVVAGGMAFTLTVTGTNFISGSRIRFNGQERTTTFGSATQLTTQLPAADIAARGTARISVFNPAPGGGTSSDINLTIAGPIGVVSAASFVGQAIAPDSIAAVFGAEMATGVELAPAGQPLPTTLLGTRISVRDSAGVSRDAPLFFVAPTQINFAMPAGLAIGAAQMTITSGDGKVSFGTLNIAVLAPGYFTANANGAGVPAAVVLRFAANGAQTVEELSMFQNGQFVPRPIDLGPDGDLVFLVMFGTGMRGASGIAAANATLGGANLPVLFIGAAPGFVGLDQANLGEIPRSLIGRGNVDLVTTADGRAFNRVTVNIK